jgi:hypothetical protein
VICLKRRSPYIDISGGGGLRQYFEILTTPNKFLMFLKGQLIIYEYMEKG